jgi:hypothetical protein
MSLVLRHCRKDVDGEAIRHRHIRRNEVNAALHQVRNQCGAACQPVQSGDYELRTVNPAVPEGFFDDRPITLGTALDLRQFGDQLAGACFHVGAHGKSLRLKAESRTLLPS